MIYHRSTTGAYDMWADLVDDERYRLTNLQHYFMRSASLTAPDNEIRRANATTLYEADAFSTPGGPIQVGYTNWVSVWTTWLERGLQAVGFNRTLGFNTGQLLGYHYSQTTIRSETQSRSASDEYLALVQGNPLLKVYSQTMVKQILFNGTAAFGVRVSSSLVERNIHARREVILSAGAFQSPQLLMVSGIGPPATLSSLGIPLVSALSGVGQNMWDHIILGKRWSPRSVLVDCIDCC
jgi:choline dehydrogenase